MALDRLTNCCCCKHDTATATHNTHKRRKAPLLRAIALSCLLLLWAPIVALAASAAPASTTAAPPAAPVAASTPAPSPVTATAPALDEHSLLDDLDPEEFEAALLWIELEQTPDAAHADDADETSDLAAAETDASTPQSLAAEPAVTATVLETGALASCLTFLTSFFISADDSSSSMSRSGRRIGASSTVASSSGSSSWLSSVSQTVASAGWPSLIAAGVVGLGALVWLLSSDSESNPCARSSRPASKRGARRPEPQPLLIELPPGHRRGRVQGMDWVAKSMKKDEDGDEAHEFLGPF